MRESIPVSEGERANRVARLRKIGLTEIPSTLPKLKLHGREVNVRRSEYPKHYYDVKVESLDHLKHLVGNPDRPLETNGKKDFVPYPMDAREVPDGNLGDFSKLSRLEQVSVQKAAKNLVFGHSRALGLSESKFNALSEWILRYGAAIPVFHLPDLEVPDGTNVVFADAGVLHFGTVTVHGSGSIKCENSVKIIVDDMRVVP